MSVVLNYIFLESMRGGPYVLLCFYLFYSSAINLKPIAVLIHLAKTSVILKSVVLSDACFEILDVRC